MLYLRYGGESLGGDGVPTPKSVQLPPATTLYSTRALEDVSTATAESTGVMVLYAESDAVCVADPPPSAFRGWVPPSDIVRKESAETAMLARYGKKLLRNLIENGAVTTLHKILSRVDGKAGRGVICSNVS